MKAEQKNTEIKVLSELWNAYSDTTARAEKQPQNALFHDYAREKKGISQDNLILITNKSNLKKELFGGASQEIRKVLGLSDRLSD